jgi:hypothetical protein
VSGDGLLVWVDSYMFEAFSSKRRGGQGGGHSLRARCWCRCCWHSTPPKTQVSGGGQQCSHDEVQHTSDATSIWKIPSLWTCALTHTFL